MFVFELPEIGEGVVEGEIVQWLVAEGDTIRVDQPICEVMTDKATVEISTPKGGHVARLHGKPGDIVRVHSPLVEIDDSAGGAAAPPQAPAPKAAAPVAAAPVAKAPVAAAPAAPAPVAAASVAKAPAAPPPAPAAAPRAATSPGKTLATPAVRSHARGQGVDIAQVAGSGKDGRITRPDVDGFAAVADQVRIPSAIELPGGPRLGVGTRPDESVRIIGMRRKIAQKMTESYRLVPHFTYVDEVDASRLVALRKLLKGDAEAAGAKLTFMPFIMKALVSVFREFPTVNALMNEEAFELTARGEVNLGIATDTPAGLVVPVIKNVENKSILDLALELQDLTARVRDGKARLDDLQGGTFTITSVGNIGGRFATPIINHPEVAILGVNQIHDRPVAIDGKVEVRPMMYLSPSFDHRVIDGAVAARFVSALKDLLERPETLLLEAR